MIEYGEYLEDIEGQYITRSEQEKATIALFYKVSELVDKIDQAMEKKEFEEDV